MLILTFCSFGQEKKFQFIVDFSEAIARFDENIYFNKNEISIGRNININEKGQFELGISYCLSGNLRIGANNQTYTFKRHFLGTRFTYNLWGSKKRAQPFLSVALFTEIGSNYKDELLSEYGGLYLKNKYGKLGDKNIARWYKGTPIVIDFLFGVSTKLTPSLNLKTAFGLGNEKLISRTLTWYDGEIENPINEINNGKKNLNSYFSWNLLIGLQYTFSFNKTLN